MPSFGATSTARLETVHPMLQKLFLKTVKGFDCSVIYGVRTFEEQKRLFRQGYSKTLESKHLIQSDRWSHAIDVAPYPIDWNDYSRFHAFGGYVMAHADMMGYPIRWGGDWDRDWNLQEHEFRDLVHFELMRV